VLAQAPARPLLQSELAERDNQFIVAVAIER
jgi:hypothetical protein